MKAINKFVESLCRVFNDISRISIFVIMLLVVINIILRAVLNSPIQGVYDILLMLSIIMISMALAYCHLTDGHVNVTFFIDRLPQGVRKVIYILIHLVNTAMFAVICWYIVAHYANKVRISQETTLTTDTPLYPFYYILAVGIFFLVLVSALKLMNEFRKEV